MQKFYTFEVKKFKKSQVCGMVKEKKREYNLNTREERKKNVDWNRTKNNECLAGVKNYKEAKEKIESLIPDSQRMKNGEVKKNLNLLVGMNISASPQYFFKGLQPPENLSDEEKEIWTVKKLDWWDKLNPESKNPIKAKEDKKAIADIWKTLDKDAFENWKKIAVEFSQREEIKNNILTLDLHMDEKRPHLEMLITPIVNNKFDCDNYWTKDSMRDWRNELKTKYASLGLEQTRDEGSRPPIPDAERLEALHLDEIEQVPPKPTAQVPAPILPKDLEQTPIPFTDKVIIDKSELEKLTNNFKKRETKQKENYEVYKDFYVKNNRKIKNYNLLNAENKVLKKENKTMKTKIKKLTDEQMENLRHIPLNEVCQQLGFEVKKESKEFYRVKTENLNLVLNTDKNSFSENKNSNNGFGAINLLVKVFGYTAKQAIEFLSGKFQPEQITKTILANPELTTSVLNETVEKINDEIPKAKELNLPRIEEYLLNRGIKKEVIKSYSRQGLIFADNKNNLVITNPNKTFAIVRGTVKLKNGEKNTFKANKGKMDFIKFQNTENPKKLYVFESAIDALAFQSLNENAKGVFISTNGNAMINRLDELNLNQFDRVIACFDNDEQGDKFTEKLRSKVDKDKFEVKKPEQKDFADDAQNFFKVLEKWSNEALEQTKKDLEKMEKVNQATEQKPTAPAPTPYDSDSKLRFGKPKI